MTLTSLAFDLSSTILYPSSSKATMVRFDTDSHDSSRDSYVDSALHEVSVKLLGLKSIVKDLTPSIRVVAALLNDGQITAKTSLSTEFGFLHEEDHEMSMAVWEDSNVDAATDATLYFDEELKVTQLGTFGRRETDIIVALVDVSQKDQYLVCFPVGIASLRIKAFGDVSHTTQLIPVLEVHPCDDVPFFTVNNPYYDPTFKLLPKGGRSVNKKFASLRLGRKHKAHRNSYSSVEAKALMPTDGFDFESHSEFISASLESGIILVDVSWKKKDVDVEAVLDISNFRIMANDVLVPPVGEEHSTSSFSGSVSVKKRSKRRDGTAASVANSIDFSTFTTKQQSVSQNSASQATVPTSNRRKIPQNTVRHVPIKPQEDPISADFSKSDKKKRFWVGSIKALSRRLHKKPTDTNCKNSTLSHVPSAVNVKSDESTTSSPSRSRTSEDELTKKSRSASTSDLDEILDAFSSNVDPPNNPPIKPKQEPLKDVKQSSKDLFAKDDLFPGRIETFESKPAIPHRQSFTRSPATEEELCTVISASMPHEVAFGDETIAGDHSTITMMKNLSFTQEPEESLNLMDLLPQCTMFDSDPSQTPVLQGYGSIMDDETTLATYETIDTYMKNKKKKKKKGSDNWWNDNGDTDDENSLGGFNVHRDSSWVLQAAKFDEINDDDELTFIPRPVDVVWTEIYKGCGVHAAEQLTDGIIGFPKKVGSLFSTKYDAPKIKELPTLESSSDSSVESIQLNRRKTTKRATSKDRPGVRITISKSA